MKKSLRSSEDPRLGRGRDSRDGTRHISAIYKQLFRSPVRQRKQRDTVFTLRHVTHSRRPTRGWYLLIKSSDKAFSLAQPHVALQPSRSSNPTSEFTFTVKSSTARPVQDGHSDQTLVPLNFVLAAHAADKDKKPVNRLSLRAITEVFASTRNSFRSASTFVRLLSVAETRPDSLFLDEAGVRKQILHFEDHPSLLHADTTGTLTLHENIAISLGIDRTFFVTAAIAYLAFLEDQEVSLPLYTT